MATDLVAGLAHPSCWLIHSGDYASWVTGQNNTFGTTSATNTSAAATWLRPTGVINGRMFKMGMQIDF